MSDEPKAPQPPEELWMLWQDDFGWAESCEDFEGASISLVLFSEAAAMAAAEWLNRVDAFERVCRPIRVK